MNNNDYASKINNIMDKAKEDVKTQIDRAYQQGYADAKSELGQNAIDLAHEESDRAYQQGLEDAWEAAKKLVLQPNEGGLSFETIYKIFDKPEFLVLENDSASEAISKIKAYEEQQKQDTIQVGDEVDYHGDKYIVTLIANGGYIYTAISADGSHILRASKDDITVTGRHFPQIAEVLAEMRGDKE